MNIRQLVSKLESVWTRFSSDGKTSGCVMATNIGNLEFDDMGRLDRVQHTDLPKPFSLEDIRTDGEKFYLIFSKDPGVY